VPGAIKQKGVIKMKFGNGAYVKVNTASDIIGVVVECKDDSDKFCVFDEDGDRLWWNDDELDEVAPDELSKLNFRLLPAFTEDYDAVIRFEEKILKVGCQEIPFEKISDLYNAIKHAL
jgi:hypothetical protein